MDGQEKEMFERITAVESSVKSLHKRVDRHEKLIEGINELATEIRYLREDTNEVKDKVSELESKPQKRWDAVIAAVISAIVGGAGTFILTKLIGG